MALSDLGYHRPTYDEILETKIETAKELFGEDIDTSEQTPLGKFIRIGAYDLEQAYEDLEGIYYARFPNTASGVSLDRVCVFAGISRNPATYSRYTITVNGDAGTEVSEINVCGENTEIVFHNYQSFVIGEDGTATIEVECETAGAAGNGIEITSIVNPIANVDSVSNSVQTLLGEEVESDYDLRLRFAQAIEGAGSANTNSIRTAILRVSTVKSVSIIENAENTTDASGRPPHSFECYVYGGESHQQEIAQAIFDKKPIGIKSCTTSDGATAVTKTVVDEGGTEHTISFSHAENVPVYVVINYKTNDFFEADGETQIKNALIEYINNLGISSDVVLSSLYGYIYSVAGIKDVTSLQIGTSAESVGASNISTETWQVPFTDATKIILTDVTEG